MRFPNRTEHIDILTALKRGRFLGRSHRVNSAINSECERQQCFCSSSITYSNGRCPAHSPSTSFPVSGGKILFCEVALFYLKQFIRALPTRHPNTTRDDSLLLGVLFHNALHAPFESSLCSDFGSSHCRYALTYQPAHVFQFTCDWHDIDALHLPTWLQMRFYPKNLSVGIQ